MPAFYPRTMASQMPLTPPDSGTGYGYGNMQYCSDLYAQQSMAQSRRDGAYEYPPGYMQSTPNYPYPSHSGYQSGNSLPLPPIQSYYEPMGAPILPPLRIQDQAAFSDDFQRRMQHDLQAAASRSQQAVAPKEEKATGGVSAKLDYDMDRMTDFVVSAVESIFQHTMQNPPSFRKWLHQVLCATRLPSTTILLSLHYLHDRVANRPESIVAGENQIYRLLAVALILGSKFLDDNTFINRSWSDVTAIKVAELNLLEMQWLNLLDFRLHIDPKAPRGLPAWIDAWKTYDAKHAAKPPAPALSPLDTHGQRNTFPAYPSPYSASSGHFSGTPYPSTDPWAPSDNSAFDEFYKRQHRYPTLTEIDDVNRRYSQERSRQSSATPYTYQHSSQPAYYPPPTHNSPWASQPSWNSGMHRYDCSCAACAYQHHFRPYPMASSYAAQTVMG